MAERRRPAAVAATYEEQESEEEETDTGSDSDSFDEQSWRVSLALTGAAVS